MKAVKSGVRKIAYVFSLLLCIAVVFFSSVFDGKNTLCVKADTGVVGAYEQTDVMDDLQGAEIGGKVFNLSDYAFDVKKVTQVITFVEFCYSFYPEKQDDFGLYFYVFNPKGLTFVVDSPLNKISIRYGDKQLSTKCGVTYLSRSEEENIEGLFYKFKVALTKSQREAILENVNSGERLYRVNEVELLQVGNTNATTIEVGKVYKYSGYAAGYGANAEAESTVKMMVEDCDTLALDVQSTVYRPAGTNGKDDYTQDSLHSVYFAVPKRMERKYGGMTAVHAEWLNAVLAPMLVTSNAEAYAAIFPYLGRNIGEGIDDLDYGYVGAYDMHMASGWTTAGFMYNCNVLPTATLERSGQIERLSLMFESSGEVPTETIKEEIKRISAKMEGEEMVNGKYARALFSHVDEAFTEIVLTSEDVMKPLTSVTVGASFWDKLWGIKQTETFDGIQAIYPVTADDVVGGKSVVSDRLYISESDYDDFMSFYTENAATSTVYLFRYQVSDYVAQTATRFKRNSYGYMQSTGAEDGYFSEETVNLDFDVIDVTFSNGETETVIGVVSNPIDVIGILTPPVSGDLPLWVWIVAAIVAIVVLYVIVRFFGFILAAIGWIFKVIWWVISLPFRFVIWIVRSIGGDYD